MEQRIKFLHGALVLYLILQVVVFRLDAGLATGGDLHVRVQTQVSRSLLLLADRGTTCARWRRQESKDARWWLNLLLLLLLLILLIFPFFLRLSLLGLLCLGRLSLLLKSCIFDDPGCHFLRFFFD